MTLSVAASLASHPQREAILKSLTPKQAEELHWEWRFWARPEQIAPEGDWSTWLALAGRGWGKTEAGAQWVRERVKNGARMIALVAETSKDLEEVMAARIIAVHPPKEAPTATYRPLRLRWPNGAIAYGYNGNEPDQLRGPEFDTAWCFVAGTSVHTPNGLTAIENIRPGDFVVTRKGPRKVSYTSRRVAHVGRVSFANGQSLIGTADHPVYTAHGWTAMQSLKHGDRVCAISALSGAERLGTDMVMGITSAVKNQTFDALSFCTERFTRTILAESQKVAIYITSTRTRQTTIPQTCGRLLDQSIASFTKWLNAIGAQSQGLRSGVAIADVPCSAGRTSQPYARHAVSNEQNKSASMKGSANTAGANSSLGPGTFAVSVASTWQPMGQQEVFCLNVDGEPEYFANGILVHNCDELAKYRKTENRDYAQETWDMLQFTMRRGTDPRVCVTTTPRPAKVIKALLNDGSTAISRGSTFDNAGNLPPQFIDKIRERYEGTRLGRQELYAEVLDDVPGALWTRDRIHYGDAPSDMRRVVVAVDPSGASGASDEGADSIGIVVAGEAHNGRFYVIEDATCRLSPAGWGRRVIERYSAHKADVIVAEKNFGGAMVEAVIRAADRNANVKMVSASRGKSVRAEPVAALYEQGRVTHAGGLDELEDQMMQMTGSGYVGEGSPDRVDALVWAMHELALEDRQGGGFVVL